LKDPKKYQGDKKDDHPHIEYFRKGFPLKLKWTDEEIYQDQIDYYDKENIGEDGEVYSTYNPDSKWDWYVIGGRWRNQLKLIEGKKEFFEGENGINKDIQKKGWCDSARIKDVDWDGMKIDNEKKYSDLWDEAYERLKNEAIKEDGLHWDYGIEKGETKEEYVARSSKFNFYSVLIDNEWLEAGAMGWFGMGTEGKEKDKWDEEQSKMLDKLKKERPEDIITMVDCHI